MISVWWLLLIVPVACCVGIVILALCRINSDVDDKGNRRLPGPDSDRRRHT